MRRIIKVWAIGGCLTPWALVEQNLLTEELQARLLPLPGEVVPKLGTLSSIHSEDLNFCRGWVEGQASALGQEELVEFDCEFGIPLELWESLLGQR